MPVGPCSSCGEVGKYRCPKCNADSCSLSCVNAHKATSGCSGLIDPAASVPLSAFNARQLRRDFQFLDDCQRTVDTITRGSDASSSDAPHRLVPKAVQELRDAAKERGVVCQFLSEGMSKRVRNTSRYDSHTDTYTWHVQFTFVTDDSEFVVHSHWGNEKYAIGELARVCWAHNPPLSAIHTVTKGASKADEWLRSARIDCLKEADAYVAPLLPPTSVPESDDQDTQITKERIDRFLSKCAEVGPEAGYVILVRSERIQTAEPTYVFIDPTLSVHQAIRKIFFICEFPEFYVVPCGLLDRFPRTAHPQLVKLRESFRKTEPTPPPKKGGKRERPAGICKFVMSENGCIKGESCPFVHPSD